MNKACNIGYFKYLFNMFWLTPTGDTPSLNASDISSNDVIYASATNLLRSVANCLGSLVSNIHSIYLTSFFQCDVNCPHISLNNMPQHLFTFEVCSKPPKIFKIFVWIPGWVYLIIFI